MVNNSIYKTLNDAFDLYSSYLMRGKKDIYINLENDYLEPISKYIRLYGGRSSMPKENVYIESDNILENKNYNNAFDHYVLFYKDIRIKFRIDANDNVYVTNCPNQDIIDNNDTDDIYDIYDDDTDKSNNLNTITEEHYQEMRNRIKNETLKKIVNKVFMRDETKFESKNDCKKFVSIFFRNLGKDINKVTPIEIEHFVVENLSNTIKL